ncbi:MAG: DNA-processing protein DprA [Bdellovibrionales bacterium]|nr:DNA-processing protein DprA [Bdellovibrionales bacterium]
MPLYHLLPLGSRFSALWSVPRPELQELWIEAKNESALELLTQLPHRGLAVVGTRRPHPQSEHFTEAFLRSIRGSELIILSGLARGIDRVAHEEALHHGLPTIAVLGCGHHHHYPPESAVLREQIITAGGLVISEFPPDSPPLKQNFVKRNRCIAAWSHATCVIEAPAKSGALITADYAMERHATVFCVPSFPGDPAFAGNQRLLDEHAAIPLWAAHSLGAAWLEFAAHQTPPELPFDLPLCATLLKKSEASL